MNNYIFEQVYIEYRNMIYNYILTLVYDKQSAEDLTQDVFIRVFKSLNKFRGDSSLKVWLFSIAGNVCFSWMKKDSKIKENERHIPDSMVSETKTVGDKNLLIEEAFKILDYKQKTLIMLRDHYGFTYKEISNILKLTEGQVKIGLHRARKAFRSAYGRRNSHEK